MTHNDSACSTSHAHGGNAAREFARLGVSERGVIDFSVNVNPLGPPEIIAASWPDFLKEIGRYPSQEGQGVREYYRKRYGLNKSCVLPGNGSIELIYLALRVISLGCVGVVSPSFHDYARAARLDGTRIAYLPLSAGNGFEALSEDVLQKSLTTCDGIIIGNPNNPTGTLFKAETILRLAAAHPEKWFLVDEAFMGFVENGSDFSLISKIPLSKNVLVFHSLTKFYAVPGLRLGAVISHPDTIARICEHKEPWTVNAVAEKAAALLADCATYENETRRLIFTERKRIEKRLGDLQGITVIKPSANFFLARWTASNNLDDLLKFLLERGIFVRDCRNFPGLSIGWFRFAIRLPHENDMLVDALCEAARRGS